VFDAVRVHDKLIQKVGPFEGVEAHENGEADQYVGNSNKRFELDIQNGRLFEMVQEDDRRREGRLRVVFDFDRGQQLSLGNAAQVGERLE